MNVKKKPVKPHRRSKTDPKDLSAKNNMETESNEGLGSSRNSDVISTTIVEALEISDEQSKDKVVADIKAKASDILAKVRNSPKLSEKRIENDGGTSDELVPEIVGEKEGRIQTERENNQQGAEERIKEMDNKSNVVNKENEVQTKLNVQIENKEESNLKEKVLKELNIKKDVSRPLLEMSRRCESLKHFGAKDKSEKSTMKSPLRRGFSLNSIEQSDDKLEEKNGDRLKLSKLMQSEKPNKSESSLKDNSNDSQNSAEKMSHANVSEMESKVSMHSSLVKGLDADKAHAGAKLRENAYEKDKTPGQPAWIELANTRSKRLSHLLDDNKDNQVTHAPYVIIFSQCTGYSELCCTLLQCCSF